MKLGHFLQSFLELLSEISVLFCYLRETDDRSGMNPIDELRVRHRAHFRSAATGETQFRGEATQRLHQRSAMGIAARLSRHEIEYHSVPGHAAIRLVISTANS